MRAPGKRLHQASQSLSANDRKRGLPAPAALPPADTCPSRTWTCGKRHWARTQSRCEAGANLVALRNPTSAPPRTGHFCVTVPFTRPPTDRIPNLRRACTRRRAPASRCTPSCPSHYDRPGPSPRPTRRLLPTCSPPPVIPALCSPRTCRCGATILLSNRVETFRLHTVRRHHAVPPPSPPSILESVTGPRCQNEFDHALAF